VPVYAAVQHLKKMSSLAPWQQPGASLVSGRHCDMAPSSQQNARVIPPKCDRT